MPIDDYYKTQKLKKPIALGTDIFANMGNAHYVDKTLLVKDIIDSETRVILFTRPRRFGKTLAMTMLQTFFEKPLDGKDTSHYFKNLKIWQAGEKYTSEQGKRPVISLSLKEVEYSNFQSACNMIKDKISDEYSRHGELEDSSNLDEREKSLYKRLKDKNASENEWDASLRYLCTMLEKHYGIKPLLLIDEYDVPLQHAWLADNSYFKEMAAFIKKLFSAALKTNSSLYKGILTGITRVSKESVFSGLNNIIVNTIFDEEFSQYFGFTWEEVRDMFDFYGISDKLSEAQSWYDGYMFGNTEIYNPWSVLQYIYRNCIAMAYWVNTSDNALMGEMLSELGKEELDKLENFVKGGVIEKDIETNIIFPELKSNPDLIYSLLAQTGYLKSIRTEPSGNGYHCHLKIPNREISFIYSDEVIRRFMPDISARQRGKALLGAIIRGDVRNIQTMMEEYFIKCCSFMDLTEERDYHNFILGLLAAVADGYEVKSNRESGKGRYDIVLKPHGNRRYLPGIIMEIKYCKPSKSKNPNPKRQQARLEREANKALEQIEEKQYAAEMNAEGITDIIRYGAAFTGKDAKIIRLNNVQQ